MSRTQKILTGVLWGLMVLVMVSVIGASWWNRDDRDPDPATVAIEPGTPDGEVMFEAPAFALVDQDNRPVSNDTLRGTPWVAAFIFTTCAGPCPMMSANMRKLQERVPNPQLRLVSFTVDPKRDTPEVLKRYAQSLGADESRWSFLTGSEQAMADVARGMLMAHQPATETEPILHSTKFLLIDKDGGVRGVYSSDPQGMDQLATDAAALVGEAASAAAPAAPTTAPAN